MEKTASPKKMLDEPRQKRERALIQRALPPPRPMCARRHHQRKTHAMLDEAFRCALQPRPVDCRAAIRSAANRPKAMAALRKGQPDRPECGRKSPRADGRAEAASQGRRKAPAAALTREKLLEISCRPQPGAPDKPWSSTHPQRAGGLPPLTELHRHWDSTAARGERNVARWKAHAPPHPCWNTSAEIDKAIEEADAARPTQLVRIHPLSAPDNGSQAAVPKPGSLPERPDPASAGKARIIPGSHCHASRILALRMAKAPQQLTLRQQAIHTLLKR